MDALYLQTLIYLERAVDRLSRLVPPPQLVAVFGARAYRYLEQTPQQAIVQKLVRLLTGLHAAQLLLEHGLLQEQAALQRMLDEVQEDVCFLAYGLIFDKQTDLHAQF